MRGTSSLKLPLRPALDCFHFKHLVAVLIQSISKAATHELVANDVRRRPQVSQRLAFGLPVCL